MTDPITRLNAALEGRYAIERELGAGGMATVYLADDLKHERKVAVKVLKPELAAVVGAERFLAEIKTTANLQHPHILPLFDSGEADTFLFYVMPYVEGESLRERLDREKQLGIDEAVTIAVDVAGALDYAHRQNVIHRDIKPENILLHDGRPMVADFGIALAVSAAAGNRMTETGLSLGTPHYMSPEQATAEKRLSNRSDIYSLGAVMYEMLTGDPPHTGSSAQQIIMKIVTDEARPVTELRKTVPQNVAAAVSKALEKLPADRFEGANALCMALSDPTYGVAQLRPNKTGPVSSRREQMSWILAGAFALLFLWTRMAGPPTASLPQPTRFNLPVPEGQTMGWETRPQLAVSPDGRTIAYVSNRKLFVRLLATAEATVVHEGEPVAPAFSPDGGSILFFEYNQLKRVSASGGAATLITDAWPFGMAMDWTPGGIYYSRVDGIYRISETGGDPTQVTSLADESEAQHQWPQLVGDDLLLFTAVGPSLGWDDSKLVLYDLDAGVRVWQLKGGMFGSYVRSGHIVYPRSDGTVLALPFDITKRSSTGAPTPVLQDVRVGEDLGGASFAISDGGTIVYVSDASPGSHILQRRDRTGVIKGQLGEPGSWDQPNLSHDGTRIALTHRTATNDDVSFVDVSTGAVERFTFGLREDETPLWSPDDNEIVFTAYGGRQRHVYRQRVAGGDPQLIFVSDFHLHVNSWSPDGRWLLVDFPDSVSQHDVWALELGDSVVARPLFNSPATEWLPVFSPDGRWIAYAIDEDGDQDIFVGPWPSGTEKYQVSVGGGTWPAWSADGRSLFFFQPDGDQALMIEAELQIAPRFARTTLDTLFSVPARDAQRALLVLPDGDFLLLAYNPDAIEYEISVVENFLTELLGLPGNE